jgi:acyl-CoA thioester hydrolase
VTAFQWPVRVYYEDTDAGGVVYHTSYIRFLERARTEWLRALGYTQSKLNDEQHLLFSVVSLAMQYHSPARLDDLLNVGLTAHVSGGASVTFRQTIVRQADDVTLASGEVRVACLDSVTFKPRRLPEDLRKEFV